MEGAQNFIAFPAKYFHTPKQLIVSRQRRKGEQTHCFFSVKAFLPQSDCISSHFMFMM
jgi:hypothetical protein